MRLPNNTIEFSQLKQDCYSLLIVFLQFKKNFALKTINKILILPIFIQLSAISY